jgi:hypothetical protein
MRVRLTNEPDGAICLESPYDRAFVDSLKQVIEYGGRQWDSQRKRWIISALYTTDLLAFLQRHGVQVQDDRDVIPDQSLTAAPPMPDDLRQAFDVLYLAYTAPLCVAESSFKALVKYFHPDKGGDTEEFHKVNDAIIVIRRYLDPPQETMDDDIPF